MWWQWLIVGILLVVIPFWVYIVRWCTLKNAKSSISLSIVDRRFIVLCFLYWLCDLFYVGFILDSITYKFIIGSLIIVLAFYSLFSELVRHKNTIRFDLVQELLICIMLTVYLIYIIPDRNLQQILIPLIAAIYGGLLTLSGVALTIIDTKKEKYEQELKQAKPLVFIRNPAVVSTQEIMNFTTEVLSSLNVRGTLKIANKGDISYGLFQILLCNSDFSYAALIGFRVNDDYHLYDYGQVLAKNEKYRLLSEFKFKFEDEIHYFAFLLRDMLDNIYELEVKIETLAYDKKKYEIVVISGLDTNITTLPINSKEI